MYKVKSVYANLDGNSNENNFEKFKDNLQTELNNLISEGYTNDNIQVKIGYFTEQIHALIIAYKEN